MALRLSASSTRARPIPRFAPVIRIVLPAMFMECSLRLGFGSSLVILAREMLGEVGAPVGPAPVDVDEAVLARELPRRERVTGPTVDVGVGRQGGDRAPDVTRRLGGREVLVLARALEPVVLRHAEVVQDGFGSKEAGSERERRDAMRLQLGRLCLREADDRRLGEVVEEAAAIVLADPVGDFDYQPSAATNHEGRSSVAGDDVGLDRLSEQREPVLERVLPERHRPLGERIATPDVVDEDVELPAVFALDARQQLVDLVWVAVIDQDGDAVSAGGTD